MAGDESLDSGQVLTEGVGLPTETPRKEDVDPVVEFIRRLKEEQEKIDTELIALHENPTGSSRIKNLLDGVEEKTRIFHMTEDLRKGRVIIASNLPHQHGEAYYYPVIIIDGSDSPSTQVHVGFIKTEDKKHRPAVGLKSHQNREWRHFWGAGSNDIDILNFANSIDQSQTPSFTDDLNKRSYERRSANTTIRADESPESTEVFSSAFKSSLDKAKSVLTEVKQGVEGLSEVPRTVLGKALGDVFGDELTDKPKSPTPFPPPPAANRTPGPPNPTGQ